MYILIYCRYQDRPDLEKKPGFIWNFPGPHRFLRKRAEEDYVILKDLIEKGGLSNPKKNDEKQHEITKRITG